MGNVADNIRNIAVIGHGGEGKTSLCEAILFNAKATDRLGKVIDGNTVMDYDEQEIARKSSISTGVAYANWNGVKINLLDVPGFYDFEGEMHQALRAADSALLVMGADGTVSVGAEKALDYCIKNHIPLFIFINGMDKENASFVNTVAALKAKYTTRIAPIQLPIMIGGKMKGYISSMSKEAFLYSEKGPQKTDIPADLQGELDDMYAGLTETAAESDDELMEKYFESMSLEADEVVKGLCASITKGDAFPVVAGSALLNKGVISLMDDIVTFMPSPAKTISAKAVELASDKEITLACDADAPFACQVFKTVVDPFVGKLNMIRVFSGTLTSGTTVYNANSEKPERISQLYLLKGKKQESVSSLCAGDIGAVSKLSATNTGDTLCDETRKLKFEPIVLPEPVLSLAVYAEKKGDEDKLFGGLNKLAEEDLTFRVSKNVETNEMILSGQGDTHLDIICKKLRAKFNVGAKLVTPRIAYRETIRGSAEAEGKHKKQSGGAGQFGQVSIKFEAGAADGEFEFVDAVVGGAVPRQFIPAVEKGLREAIKKGVLAEYPMVDLKCTLFDGKYHPVDSKEIAFVTAAKLAYAEALPKARPCFLEPIMEIAVTVPDAYQGAILGDANKRRGRVMGTDMVDGLAVITLEAPQAEMVSYVTDLRAMTQGRGKFTMKFLRYEEVPASENDKIIKERAKEKEEAEKK